MKVLITGASGQLGHDAAKTLTDFERKALYDSIKKDALLMEYYKAMRLWLREQDKKQRAMKTKAFIEEL